MANGKKALAPGTRIDSDDAPDFYWDSLKAVIDGSEHKRYIDVKVNGETVREVDTKYGRKCRVIMPGSHATISRDGVIGTSDEDEGAGLWLPLRFAAALLAHDGETIRVVKTEEMKGAKVVKTGYRAEIPDRKTASAGE